MSAIGLVMELAQLAAVLGELRYEYRTAKQIKTHHGEMHSVDMIFKDAVGRDIGVKRTGTGYRLIFDRHDLSKEQIKKQTASIQQVVQRYAYRKVLKELQAQGYMVAEEEKRSDGTIRLIVRKWT